MGRARTGGFGRGGGDTPVEGGGIEVGVAGRDALLEAGDAGEGGVCVGGVGGCDEFLRERVSKLGGMGQCAYIQLFRGSLLSASS